MRPNVNTVFELVCTPEVEKILLAYGHKAFGLRAAKSPTALKLLFLNILFEGLEELSAKKQKTPSHHVRKTD
jgi:hypothetical protein